jgi:cation transport regulator ChaB
MAASESEKEDTKTKLKNALNRASDKYRQALDERTNAEMNNSGKDVAQDAVVAASKELDDAIEADLKARNLGGKRRRRATKRRNRVRRRRTTTRRRF